jgi:hypothetical protein
MKYFLYFFLLLISAIACVVQDIVEDSEIYRLSVEKIKSDPEVDEAVGGPVECGKPERIIVYTNTKSFGQADFKIPVSGSNGSGTVHIIATRRNDSWKFETFTFSIFTDE